LLPPAAPLDSRRARKRRHAWRWKRRISSG
jgi:hypothetical protein